MRFCVATLLSIVAGCSGGQPAPAATAPATAVSDASPPPLVDAAAIPTAASPADAGSPPGNTVASACTMAADSVTVADVNGDGVPDLWKHLRFVAGADVVICKRADLNFDGRADMATLYDPDSGKRLEERFDFDFDGVFDQRKIYDPLTGSQIETYHDLDGDGVWDRAP